MASSLPFLDDFIPSLSRLARNFRLGVHSLVQLPNNCFPRRYDGVGKNLTETDQTGRVGQGGLSSGAVDQSSTYLRKECGREPRPQQSGTGCQAMARQQQEEPQQSGSRRSSFCTSSTRRPADSSRTSGTTAPFTTRNCTTASHCLSLPLYESCNLCPTG